MKQYFSYADAVLDSNLLPEQRLILLSINTNMNGYGKGPFPSLAELCEWTGLSVSVVDGHISDLLAAGWLEKISPANQDEDYPDNRLKIAIPAE